MLRTEVRALQAGDGRITAVQAGEKSHRADAFVLATGHHIGGGLLKERPVREPLAGLGVFHESRPVAESGTRLQHLEYLDPAPQFQTGLMTDERLRPFDATGQVAYQNLYAAGFVYCCDRAFVSTIRTPCLVLAGNDEAHAGSECRGWQRPWRTRRRRHGRRATRSSRRPGHSGYRARHEIGARRAIHG